MMNCSEARIRLAGYVDGELSSSECAHLDAHVDACSACRRERSVQSFVSLEMRRESTSFAAPPALRRRVRAALGPRSTAHDAAWWRHLRWAMLTPAAGVAFATLFCANLVLMAALPSKEQRLAEDVLTSHVRALMTARAIDVVSSDQHTVKPWYAGKIDFSPEVIDLAGDGFSLKGGRLDYVDGRAVAALVYQHRQHLIDVFIWPASTSEVDPPRNLALRGYNVLHWTHEGMTYWAASDLDAAELGRLGDLLSRTRAM